jgi:SAM-dependent methyltransferase
MTLKGDFFGNMADQYDLVYSDKDYEAECDVIEGALFKYGHFEQQTILDMGCGTGNHSIPLARRGHKVCGVDQSVAMLLCAMDKAEETAFCTFKHGDIRNIDLKFKFDAVLMMFAVLGYQLTNEDVIATLRNARKHLKPGGLLIFDVWYGPAVLNIKPSDRVRVIDTDNGKMIRCATGNLDTRTHTAELKYHIWKLTGDKLTEEIEASHKMRYFFPMELEYMLNNCGFKMDSMTAFPSLDAPVDATTWNTLVVCHAE